MGSYTFNELVYLENVWLTPLYADLTYYKFEQWLCKN